MQGKTLVYAMALVLAGGLALLYSTYHLLDSSTKSGGNQSMAPVPSGVSAGPEEQGKNVESAGTARSSCPVISTVTLLPERPTIHDNITAKLSYEQGATADVKLSYKWFVNNKPIENVTGDTLPAGYFKKKDVVFVDVSPSVDGKQGFACRSAFKAIDSTPLKLILKENNEKFEEVIYLQLIGNDPDGDKITYALEQPLLSGMTIDKESGKITWNPSKREIGTYKFTASAATADGRKIVKIFEFKLDTK